MTAAQKREQEEAREALRSILRPGQTVFCQLEGSPSRSGMSRKINFYVIEDDDLRRISHLVARALDYRQDPATCALKVQGAGMDMGFHVVYCLGRVVWPNGTPEPHGRRNGEPDSDGGYALKSRWI